MKHIKAIQVTSTNNNKFPCEICLMARQSKSSFTKSTIRSKNYFDLIHIDTWGPYNTPTYKGEKYFLTMVDDFSRSTWTFLLSTKSNAFPTLKAFLTLVERQFSPKLKMIKSDNAFELGTGHIQKEYYNSQGIIY